MADANMTLVTEADLTATTPKVAQNAATGEMVLILPGGARLHVGDTGWRDITALLTGAMVTAGKILIRRQGRTVHLRGAAVTFAVGDAQIFALPVGYRGGGSIEWDQESFFDAKPTVRLRVNGGASFWVNSDEAATNRNFEISWVALGADGNWPAVIGEASAS